MSQTSRVKTYLKGVGMSESPFPTLTLSLYLPKQCLPVYAAIFNSVPLPPCFWSLFLSHEKTPQVGNGACRGEVARKGLGSSPLWSLCSSQGTTSTMGKGSGSSPLLEPFPAARKDSGSWGCSRERLHQLSAAKPFPCFRERFRQGKRVCCFHCSM